MLQHKSGFKLIHIAIEYNRPACVVFLREAEGDCRGESAFDFESNVASHLEGCEQYWDRELMMLAADYGGADADEYRRRHHPEHHPHADGDAYRRRQMDADLARISDGYVLRCR